MHLSGYLKVFPWEEDSDYLLLFSTKRASKTLLKKETFRSIENGTLSSSNKAVLAKLGMIVADRGEEQKELLALTDRLNAENPVLNVMVVLNLDCNFSCVYCYEDGIKKDSFYMSESTADDLIAFIKKKFTKNKTTLLIDFYGGEPLLSAGLIKYISQRLKPFAESRDACYGFTLITNGSLFNRQTAKELVELGLESVKITIDGPAETHNRYRPFKSGKGTFDIIIKNIKATCDLVKISIGGNFEETVYKKFPLLLDDLAKEGLTPDKISVVKFDPVMKHGKNSITPAGYKGGCLSINEPWLFKAFSFLREEILKRGYNTLKMLPASCIIESKDFYMVNYDGLIYKCPAFIGKKGFAAGDLQKGITDYTCAYNIGNWKNDKCIKCVYLPLCYGGCRYMALIRDGNIKELDCKKEYFDAMLETLVKQDIKYGLKARQAKTSDGKNIDVDKMTKKIDLVIENFFPEQSKSFKPPSIERMIACYHNTNSVIQTYIYGAIKDTDRDANKKEPFSKSAFFTVACIRYLDDFIDNALWPEIEKFDPVELSSRFRAFLLEALKVIKEFDENIPDKIIDLPIVEMRLALFPGQKNFDENFKKLFECKSFDLFYIYEKIQGKPVKTVDIDKLERIALMEHIRDFSPESIATDTDLNFYKYIRDNRLNPEKFIDYLICILKKEDPAGFKKLKKSGLFNGIKGIDSINDTSHNDTTRNNTTWANIPFPEHFLIQFDRAIRLLRRL